MAVSPQLRGKDYTPLLQPVLTAGLSRRTSGPVPVVPVAGSLFQPTTGQQGGSMNAMQRLQLSMPGTPPRQQVAQQQQQQQELLGRLPDWNWTRDHLTGLDVVAVSSNTRCLQGQVVFSCV